MKLDEDIKMAEEKIEYLSSDPETLEAYRARERSLHERANMISTAEMKGKAEIVKKMFKHGLDISQIAEITELTLEEIEHLK
jgi:predicted transposase/invertase (TIGR01784 family)